MICPECGSYQPDRAKYCGICGAGLSQDGLVESFLKREPEHDIVLPRHRSVLFYLVVLLIIVAALAAVAGAGYLVYRIAWGHEKADDDGGKAAEAPHTYSDPELGFTITYPDGWSIDPATPGQEELAAFGIVFTPRKAIDLRVLQLDPLVSIGGIDAIEEHLAEDAAARISSLGGEFGFGETGEPAGDGGETRQPGETTNGDPGETTTGEQAGTADEGLFDSTRVSGLPAFYAEFSANYMGEDTRFLLYYIVAGDYIFVFQGHAPSSEFKDVRPQFFAITGSFKWEMDANEQAPDYAPDLSKGDGTPAGNAHAAVITFT